MNPHSIESNRARALGRNSLRLGDFAYRFSHRYTRFFLRIWPAFLALWLVNLTLWILLISVDLTARSSITLDFSSNGGTYWNVFWSNPTIRVISIVAIAFLAALVVIWFGRLLLKYRRDVKLLRQMELESSKALAQVLADPKRDVAVRVHAAYALSEQPTPAIRALQRALTDSEPAISRAAAAALLIALRDYISAPSVLSSLPFADVAEDLVAVLAAERALAALKQYYDNEEYSYAREGATNGEDDGVVIAEQAQAALEKIGIEAPYAQILESEPNLSRDLSYDLTH